MESRDSRWLAEHAAAGDQKALDRIFSRCLPRLRRLLQLKGGSALRQSDIDDLVQEAYLQAVRQFAGYTYQGPDSFFRWLATIAIHHVQNLNRVALAQRRDRNRERPLAGADSTLRAGAVHPADAGPGPRTQAVGVEAEARLDEALGRLSADDREVILLARVQGLGLHEIAERLGRTRNAVALLLSRALRKLKAAMGEEGVDPR